MNIGYSCRLKFQLHKSHLSGDYKSDAWREALLRQLIYLRKNGNRKDFGHRQSRRIPGDGSLIWMPERIFVGKKRFCEYYCDWEECNIREEKYFYGKGRSDGLYEYEWMYEAGPKDREWLCEIDGNYLVRLLREKKLDRQEPDVYALYRLEMLNGTFDGYNIKAWWRTRAFLPNIYELLRAAPQKLRTYKINLKYVAAQEREKKVNRRLPARVTLKQRENEVDIMQTQQNKVQEEKAKQAFAKEFLDTQAECDGGRKSFLEEKSSLIYYRRLDSLAMLFEYITNCAGIALFQDKLIFAANKINKNKKVFNREQLNTIVKQTMQYFSSLAEGQSNLETTRENIFRTLCSHERILGVIKQDKVRTNIKTKDVKDIVGYMLREEEISPGDLLHDYGYGVDNGVIYKIAFKLDRIFRSVEKFIKRVSTNRNSLPEEKSLITAIQQNRLIFLPEPRDNVHAEMQLIGYLTIESEAREAKREEYIDSCRFFYLGLSKLCCHKCNAMLMSINNSGFNIKFLTRGWNNIGQPWKDPFQYSQYWVQEGSLLRNHRESVMALYNRKLREIEPPKGVDMEHDVSESEDSSIGSNPFEIIKEKQLAHILFAKFLFADLGLSEIYASYIKDDIGDVHEQIDGKHVSKIFHPDVALSRILGRANKNRELSRQLDKLASLGDKRSPKMVMRDVLQNSGLVGEDIAGYFEQRDDIFDKIVEEKESKVATPPNVIESQSPSV